MTTTIAEAPPRCPNITSKDSAYSRNCNCTSCVPLRLAANARVRAASIAATNRIDPLNVEAALNGPCPTGLSRAEREQIAIHLHARGRTTRQIADHMRLDLDTVSRYLRQVGLTPDPPPAPAPPPEVVVPGERATPTWRNRALCNTEDPEMFFPIGETDADARAQIEEAKRVCLHCPVRPTCLQRAIDGREEGVWGGTTTTERKSMIRRQQRNGVAA